MTPEEKDVMDTLLDLMNKGFVHAVKDETGNILFEADPTILLTEFKIE